MIFCVFLCAWHNGQSPCDPLKVLARPAPSTDWHLSPERTSQNSIGCQPYEMIDIVTERRRCGIIPQYIIMSPLTGLYP